MIPFRTLDDLSRVITENLNKIPEVDVVIGIPRSGLIPACLIALLRGLPVLSLESYCAGNTPLSGQRTNWGGAFNNSRSFRHALVVDDSCNNGIEMTRTRALLSNIETKCKFTFLAVYSTESGESYVDISLERVPYPRLFSWNILHHPLIAKACMDLDGVICQDPTDDENDDGPNYLNFIRQAKPKVIPSVPVGDIVTSRLEKYRTETVSWLGRHGVNYERLIMLDGWTAEERRLRQVHASHKANVFRSSDRLFFVESSSRQAREIAELSGKQVFSTEDQKMYYPRPTVRRSFLDRSRKAYSTLLNKQFPGVSALLGRVRG